MNVKINTIRQYTFAPIGAIYFVGELTEQIGCHPIQRGARKVDKYLKEYVESHRLE